ncbi:uncharacterized protein LOC136062257 [Quercus suber]|uniref:uncharacterized protein LOC136062257 n=1 Tax=Quercus suber TaxID=58331 RepID=UPI0032DF9DC2
MGKQTKANHHKVNVITTSRCLELLHVDLMGPTRTESLGEKRYIMVVVDDFSRYSWVEFLREKSEACDKMQRLCKRLQNEKEVPIVKIRSDHGKEFENAKFESFCEKHSIKKEFSAPKTPQQNWVVERKNRNLFLSRDKEDVIRNTERKETQGYSTNSRAYRVYNKRTKTMMESINMVIDDTISKNEIEDDEKEFKLKENEDVDDMALSDDAEKVTPGKESTPSISRRETRSTQEVLSPLTPPEVQILISRDEELSTTKKPSSRVTLNHPSSTKNQGCASHFAVSSSGF